MLYINEIKEWKTFMISEKVILYFCSKCVEEYEFGEKNIAMETRRFVYRHNSFSRCNRIFAYATHQLRTSLSENDTFWMRTKSARVLNLYIGLPNKLLRVDWKMKNYCRVYEIKASVVRDLQEYVYRGP